MSRSLPSVTGREVLKALVAWGSSTSRPRARMPRWRTRTDVWQWCRCMVAETSRGAHWAQFFAKRGALSRSFGSSCEIGNSADQSPASVPDPSNSCRTATPASAPSLPLPLGGFAKTGFPSYSTKNASVRSDSRGSRAGGKRRPLGPTGAGVRPVTRFVTRTRVIRRRVTRPLRTPGTRKSQVNRVVRAVARLPKPCVAGSNPAQVRTYAAN
jgi:hypothetical protein